MPHAKRGSNRALHIPSLTQALAECIFLESKITFPCRDGLHAAVPLNQTSNTRVGHLHYSRDESAITRLIVAIIVGAVYFKPRLVSVFAGPAIELTAIARPRLADGNSAATIVVPLLIPLISATIHHVAIEVFQLARMRIRDAMHAAAVRAVASHQFSASNSLLCSTVAFACDPISRGYRRCRIDDSPQAKAIAGFHGLMRSTDPPSIRSPSRRCALGLSPDAW